MARFRQIQCRTYTETSRTPSVLRATVSNSGLPYRSQWQSPSTSYKDGCPLKSARPYLFARTFAALNAEQPKRNIDLGQQCAELEKLTSYHFNDPDYFRVALSSSKQVTLSASVHLMAPQQHLAIIGDAALKLIYYTENFPSLQPKTLHMEYSEFCSNEELGHLAERSGLYDIAGYVPISTHARGTLVEAIWGAIFVDSGNDLVALKQAIDAMLAVSAQTPPRKT